jgi:hypothetical protein
MPSEDTTDEVIQSKDRGDCTLAIECTKWPQQRLCNLNDGGARRNSAMKELDRREVLTAILGGGAIVVVGLTATPRAARSLPLGTVKAGVVEPEDLVEEAR